MGIYQFNRDDAFRFAEERHIKKRVHGDELQLYDCPYCHGVSRGDRNTFAINLKTGQFKCMRASCNARGNMITLHRDFGFDLGTDVREYERPRDSWRRFKTPAEPIKPTQTALDYLTGRKISPEVIEKYEITTRKDRTDVLVFPFFDGGGNLTMVKYRNTDPSAKSKEYSEANCQMILFGMKQCVPDKPLILTEGQIDSLSVASAGYDNAVSVPTGKNGMTWIPHCWDWLNQYKEIIVFGDYEHGNMTLLADVRERFTWMRVKAVQPIDYQGCKDANELLQKYGVDGIKRAIENAAPVETEQVKRLADIPYEDGNYDEVIPTGLEPLDKTLSGGLRFGYLDIITGKRGEGKSTFASQLLTSALDARCSTFIYSGEMPKGDVRKWLDFQIAGADRVYDDNEGSGKPWRKWKLSQHNSETIGMWYKDRAFIYDTAYISDSDSPDFLAILETYISQFGCRVVLIDNLMTVVDLVGFEGEKYEKQSYICKRLAILAQKYNALILLIAHKKKSNNFSGGDEADDVFGSSEITNLAGAVISYGRGSDKDCAPDERIIKVLKNRLTGYVDFKGFISRFDERSKRVYFRDSELNKVCQPFIESAEFKQAALTDDFDIPF